MLHPLVGQETELVRFEHDHVGARSFEQLEDAFGVDRLTLERAAHTGIDGKLRGR